MDAALLPKEREELKSIRADREQVKIEIEALQETEDAARKRIVILKREMRDVQDALASRKKDLGLLDERSTKEEERTRRAKIDFAKLQLEKEDYIEERKRETEEKLASTLRDIAHEEEILGTLHQESATFFGKFVQKVDDVINSALTLFTSSEKYSESAKHYKQTAENLLAEVKKRHDELLERIKTVSTLENSLKIREEAVQKEHDEAKRKFKEAEKLAYWADKPGQYRA